MRLPQALIIDIDGTLSNAEHRTHYLKDKNWKMFFREMVNDPVNIWCKDIIDRFHIQCEIILLTGRPDSHKTETQEWLQKHRIMYDSLYMRTHDDWRQDVDIKREIYEQHIKNDYSVLFAVDDRQSIVDLWRSLGITCLQCAKGDF